MAFTEQMTADNGVRALMEAQRILRASGIQSDLLLAGTPDPADLTAIPQIEVAGFQWGTFTSAPGQLNAVVGQIVPSGALVRGLPEA